MRRHSIIGMAVAFVVATVAVFLPVEASAAPTAGPVDYVICLYEQRNPAECPPPLDGIPRPGELPDPNNLPQPGSPPSDGCMLDTYPLGVFCAMNGEQNVVAKARAGYNYLRKVPGASIFQDTLEECYYDNPNPDKVARARCIVLRIVSELAPG